MIDLAHLRQLVEAFPPAERVREEMHGADIPTAPVSMIIAARALEVAAYLEQHGGEQTVRRKRDTEAHVASRLIPCAKSMHRLI